MARSSVATLAAFACALRGNASLASEAAGSACLTVQSKVKSPVVLARSCLENQTLAGGAQLSLNLSANETVWVVPGGEDWHCGQLCTGCFSLNAEVIAAPELGGDLVGLWVGFDEAPDGSASGTAAAIGAENAGDDASDTVLGRENSTVARIKLCDGPAPDSACPSVVLEGPAEAGPTPLLRGTWRAGGVHVGGRRCRWVKVNRVRVWRCSGR